MRRLAATFVAICSVVWALSAFAQIGGLSFPGPGPKVASGGGSYTGPGDAVAFAHYWSVGPCYNNTYASPGTNQAFIVKRASDSTTQGINCLSTGLPDYSTANTFCTSTTCTVRLIKDQVGANDLSDSASQTLPTYTAASLGTCAGMSSPTGTVYLVGTSFTVAQPFTLQSISTPVDNGADSIMGELTGGGSATVQLRFWFGPNPPLTLFATSNDDTGPTITTGTYADEMGYFNGASSAGRVNSGAEVTMSPGTTGLSSANNFRLITVDSPGSIKIVQAGVMTGTQTSATRATLNTNIHTQCGGF